LESSGNVVSMIGDSCQLVKMESSNHLKSLVSQTQFFQQPAMMLMMTTMSKVLRKKLEVSLKEDSSSTLEE
jgi:hypothetical protein